MTFNRCWIGLNKLLSHFLFKVREGTRRSSASETTKLPRSNLQTYGRPLLEWTARLATVTTNAYLQTHRNPYVLFASPLSSFTQILFKSQYYLNSLISFDQAKSKATDMIRQPLIHATAMNLPTPEPPSSIMIRWFHSTIVNIHLMD